MKNPPTIFLRSLLLTSVLTLPLFADPAATTQPIDYAPGIEIARLANPAINESSGIASSRTNPGLLWTHNDSGDTARLFAFNEKGEDLGTYNVTDASAKDWEDMAAFSIEGKNFLLLADIGDNPSARKSCTLYLVAEPQVRARPEKPVAVPSAARIDFTYEDGPHNCESVAVDTARKEIVLVSKTNKIECKAYTLPLTLTGHIENAVAKPIATLKIPTTTGMDISPDNLRAIVTTYGDAYEYSRAENEDWAAAFTRAPRVIKLPPRPQGESICYGPDGKSLYLTSEGKSSPLLKITPK